MSNARDRLPSGPIVYSSFDDLPMGWGLGKVVGAARLQSAATGEGATRVGYDNTVSGIAADTVQEAIDLLALGLAIGFRNPVRVATVGANIVLAGGAPNTLDGVALLVGYRILVKDQADPIQNGIYVVQTVGGGANGTWVRAADMAAGSTLVGTTLVGVQAGAISGDLFYALTTDGTLIVGVDPQTWELYPILGALYTPTVPTNWSPAPTTVPEALNQIAARKRAYNDPNEVLAPVTLYVRTTGDDDTGIPGSLVSPFATLQGALRAVPETTSLGGYGANPVTIDIGAGTFELPAALVHWAGVIAVNCAVSVGDTRNVTAIAQNTPTGGNALTLDGAAIPAGSLRNTVVEFLTAGLVHIAYGTVYENILGNTIYFETDNLTTINPVLPIGTVVRFLQQDTVFVQTTNAHTVFHGGDAVGMLTWTGGDFSACSLEFNAGFNATFVRAVGIWTFFSTGVFLILQTCAIGFLGVNPGITVRVTGGCTIDGQTGNPVAADGGLLQFNGANSIVRANRAIEVNGTVASITAFTAGPSIVVLRVADITAAVVHANRLASGQEVQGGATSTPRILTATGIGGVAGFLAIARGGARISIGASSSVIIGGVTNPVSADNGATQSAYNQDGTYIEGGNPSPGPNGPGPNQVVVATGQTWNKTSRMVVLDSSAIGPGGTFLLPSINSVTEGCSDGITVQVKNEDGTNSVAITPFAGDTIDLAGAAVPTGASQAAINFTCRRGSLNWMIN